MTKQQKKQQDQQNQIQKTDSPNSQMATSAAKVAGMFGGQTIDVPVGAVWPRVKISRESPVFIMPDGELEKQMEGHIIYYHSVSQLFYTKFGEDDKSPAACCSSDGIKADGGECMFRKIQLRPGVQPVIYRTYVSEIGMPTDMLDLPLTANVVQVWLNNYVYTRCNRIFDLPPDIFLTTDSRFCSICSANSYGTNIYGGKGKACQNSLWMYIAIDGYKLPVSLKAPPSSLGKQNSLIPFLSNAPNIGLGGKYQTIRVEFTLARKDFDGGKSASSIIIKKLSVIESIDDPKLSELSDLYSQFMEHVHSNIKNIVSAESVDDFDAGRESVSGNEAAPF